MQKATTTGPTTRCIMCVFECLFGSSCFRFSWRRHAIAVLYDVSKVETTETFPLWDTSVSRFSVMFPRDNFV